MTVFLSLSLFFNLCYWIEVTCILYPNGFHKKLFNDESIYMWVLIFLTKELQSGR